MKKTIILFCSILFTGILIAWYLNYDQYKKQNAPGVVNPSQVNKELVDTSMQGISTGHRVSGFHLINQDGKEVDESLIEGKVFVADFFFTTCGSICPKMTSQLERVQKAFEDEDDFIILSHTVLPETDTAEVLKAYAEQHGADPGKWVFLTGDKKEIYRLARKSYFLVKEAAPGEEGDGGQSDFIHTQNFVLVDAQKRIRGYYDGTSAKDVDLMMEDIRLVLEE
ncbi:MAG: SCO family protein [Bacteroidota bacterium]